MLSPGAVVLTCLLVSAEGYATIPDGRFFPSSGKPQTKTSPSSDHGGDMTVSVAVQADGSFSEVEAREVPIEDGRVDEGFISIGEKDHTVAIAVGPDGSLHSTAVEGKPFDDGFGIGEGDALHGETRPTGVKEIVDPAAAHGFDQDDDSSFEQSDDKLAGDPAWSANAGWLPPLAKKKRKGK